MPDNILTESHKLLVKQMVGVLSTISLDVPGYPFGSIVPYGFDRQSYPVVLISRLAQHTKNIQADRRVSLFVSNVDSVGCDDVQTCSRLTILANAEPADDRDLISRYCRFYPDAADYHQNLDFDFYRLIPEKVRFIGGFGKIHWVDMSGLFIQSPFTDAHERDIIEHMNTDHADTLKVYCEKAGVKIPGSLNPEMVGVDAQGFHIRLGHKLVRIQFRQSVSSPMQARDAFIELLHG